MLYEVITVFPRKDDILERDAFVMGETDDTGEGVGGVDGADFAKGVLDDDIRFFEIQKNYGLLHAADTERFVTLVQDENATAD